jgi:hypothetical protein
MTRLRHPAPFSLAGIANATVIVVIANAAAMRPLLHPALTGSGAERIVRRL